jgi:hypothetical protein
VRVSSSARRWPNRARGGAAAIREIDESRLKRVFGTVLVQGASVDVAQRTEPRSEGVRLTEPCTGRRGPAG